MAKMSDVLKVLSAVVAATPNLPKDVAAAAAAVMPRTGPRDLKPLSAYLRLTKPGPGDDWPAFKSVVIHNDSKGWTYREVRMDERHVRALLSFLGIEGDAQVTAAFAKPHTDERTAQGRTAKGRK